MLIISNYYYYYFIILYDKIYDNCSKIEIKIVNPKYVK